MQNIVFKALRKFVEINLSTFQYKLTWYSPALAHLLFETCLKALITDLQKVGLAFSLYRYWMNFVFNNGFFSHIWVAHLNAAYIAHLRLLCIIVSSTLGSNVEACSKSSELAFSSATFTKALDSSPFNLFTAPVEMSYMKISCSALSLDLRVER